MNASDVTVAPVWDTGLVDRFVDDPTSGLRTEQTRRSYRGSLTRMGTRLGSPRVDMVTEQDLAVACYAGGVAQSTVNKRRTHLRSMFAWLAWQGVIETNPAAGLTRQVTGPTPPQRPGVWLTRRRAQALVKACDTIRPEVLALRDRAWLTVALTTGLRATEQRMLNWTDVEIVNGTAVTLTVVGKGNKVARVEVPERGAREILALREHAVDAAVDVDGFVPVFPAYRVTSRFGKGDIVRDLDWSTRIGVNRVGRLVARAGRRVGVQNLRPHDLRRTYAGLLDDAGVPLRTISQLMRHSNPSTTERYLQENPTRVAEAVRTFDL